MNLHNSVRAQCPSAVVPRCKRADCELDLAALPTSRTVVDADVYARDCGHHGTICDFLVFWSGPGLGAAAIEMKARAWDAGTVQRQLQAGAQLIDKLAGQARIERFQPVLVHEGAKRRAEITSLLNKKITLRGDAYRIVRRRCGQALEP